MLEAEEKLQEQLALEKEKLGLMEEKNEDINKDISKEDPYLEEALKSGYDPNYNGPNKKSPEQFVKDGSFFKKIDEQKKRIEALEKSIKEANDRSLKIEEITRKRVLDELEVKKKQAFEEGDYTKFEQFNAEQDKIKTVPVEPPKVEQAAPPEVVDFLERNKDWCNKNTPENELMFDSADALCRKIARQAELRGEQLTLSEQMRRVESEIKQLFPERFVNVEREKPALTTVSEEANDGRKNLSSRLTSQQKYFVKQARSLGSKLTEEEYAKQLQMIGELRDE